MSIENKVVTQLQKQKDACATMLLIAILSKTIFFIAFRQTILTAYCCRASILQGGMTYQKIDNVIKKIAKKKSLALGDFCKICIYIG